MASIEQLEAWLRDKPTDRFALYSLALELKRAGRTDEALARFAALLEAHPTSGAGHYQHGLLHRELGDMPSAKASWEAGLTALAGLQDADARRSRSEIQGALDDLELEMDDD